MYIANRCLAVTACLFAVFFCGCGGAARPTVRAHCIKPTQNNLLIRWVTDDDSLHTHEAYELNTFGEVYRTTATMSDTSAKTYLGFVEANVYCETAKNVQATFLKVQAMSVRGKRGRYIEYVNAEQDVYLRAMWNPDLSTFQSRDMRQLFDELMALVPKN